MTAVVVVVRVHDILVNVGIVMFASLLVDWTTSLVNRLIFTGDQIE